MPACSVSHSALTSRVACCRCPPRSPSTTQFSVLSWTSHVTTAPELLPLLSPSPWGSWGLTVTWGKSGGVGCKAHLCPTSLQRGSPDLGQDHLLSQPVTLASQIRLVLGDCSCGAVSVPAGLPGLVGAARIPSEQCLGHARLHPPQVCLEPQPGWKPFREPLLLAAPVPFQPDPSHCTS